MEKWAIFKRRYAFVNSSGSLPRSRDTGAIDGTLILAPLYPVKENRSEEMGRFTVWRQADNGTFQEKWVTESELRAFTNWPEVEAKLEAAKAAVAKLPPLEIGTTSPTPPDATPPAELLPPTPPVEPLPKAPEAKASAGNSKELVGVVLLVLAIGGGIAWVSKRRA